MNCKLQHLKWFDIVILAMIMFAEAIYISTIQYFEVQTNPLPPDQITDFSAETTYSIFFIQLILLFIAFLYLKYRNFDFNVWVMEVSIKSVFQGVFLFIILALCINLYALSVDLFLYGDYIQSIGIRHIYGIEIFTAIYSVLNGFYEEIFFLGICLAVKPDYIKWSFLFSLLIRFSFHTYQGMAAAFGIGILMGCVFFFFYQKSYSKNLVPFFLAHTIADIIGLHLLDIYYQDVM